MVNENIWIVLKWAWLTDLLEIGELTKGNMRRAELILGYAYVGQVGINSVYCTFSSVFFHLNSWLLFHPLSVIFSHQSSTPLAVIFLECKSDLTISSVPFNSVTQSCPTLCNSMDCSTPGFPVHHQLPEFTRTHVHWVSDAIQPSHPLSSPSAPTFNLSQHQGLCKWVSSLHEVAKGLEFQLQHQSFQWKFRTDFF